MTKPTLEPRASQRVWSPMIAITPDYNANEDAPAEATYCVRMNYASALADAGALPVILPTFQTGLTSSSPVSTGS